MRVSPAMGTNGAAIVGHEPRCPRGAMRTRTAPGTGAASALRGLRCGSPSSARATARVGGIEEKARVLIEAFRAQGHAVTVLARGEPATSGSDGDVPVVRRKYHQMPRRARHVARQLRFLRDLPRATRALRRAVTDTASDVVLTLAITSYAPYASALAAAAPLVLSLEGGEPGGRFTANPRALRAALRRPTRLVACARSVAASVRALAPEVEARLSVIPNGVEPGLFADGP